MNNTVNHVVVETSDCPELDFRAELHLERNEAKCNWVVNAWVQSDKAKVYGAKFTSYRKAWKAYENAFDELRRRYNWKPCYDRSKAKPEQLTGEDAADAEALLAGLEDL